MHEKCQLRLLSRGTINEVMLPACQDRGVLERTVQALFPDWITMVRGPGRCLVMDPSGALAQPDAPVGCYVVEQSGAWSEVSLWGRDVGGLLQSLFSIDTTLEIAGYVETVCADVPVILRRLAQCEYALYVPRSYGVWLVRWVENRIAFDEG